jgi:hypothetical protein
MSIDIPKSKAVDSNRVYRLRATTQSGKYKTYSLTVPREMAEPLLHAGRTAYRCEFHPEGILFRPVAEQAPTPAALPDWAQPDASPIGLSM